MRGFETLGMKPEVFLNTVREAMPEPYRAQLPICKAGQMQYTAIGEILEEDDVFASRWHKTALMLVAKVLQRDNKIVNPLSEFEGEFVPNGKIIEEMMIDAAESCQFNPTVAEKRLFARRKPDLKAVLHTYERDIVIPKTIQDSYINEMFNGPAELDRYVIQVMQSMMSGNEQEKYFETKMLISRSVKSGKIRMIDLGNRVSAKELQKQILKHSKKMLHPSRYYNMGNVGQPDNKGRTGLSMQADKDELRMLLSVDTSVSLNTDFFANAFHLDPVKSDLAIKEVDVFPNVYEYTSDHEVTHEDLARGFVSDEMWEVGDVIEKGALASEAAYEYYKDQEENDIELVFDASRIQAVILDRRAMIINPRIKQKITSQPNAMGRYVNLFLHDKMLFSYSPFMPAVVILANEVTESDYVKDVQVDNESIVDQKGVAKINYTSDVEKAIVEVFGDGVTADQIANQVIDLIKTNSESQSEKKEAVIDSREESSEKQEDDLEQSKSKTKRKKKTD